MKIAQVVPSLEVRYGGPSKSVLGLAAALARNGEDVSLLTTDPDGDWTRSDGPLSISAFQRGRPGSICVSAGLKRALQGVRTDVVHHHSIWLRTLHYSHMAARRSGASLVVSPRGMMDPWAWHHHIRRKAIARRFIHPGAFESVDGWHATSAEEEGSLRALGFNQPICVAPNGVAAPTQEELTGSATYWRNVLGPQADRPIALFYSRLHRKKRLIELMDLWFEKGPEDWLLLIVGIPEDYTVRMLETYALRAGYTGRILVFDGIDLPPPYAIASLFLLPSHGENFGLSIAEAMASGVPVLVTDTTPWHGVNDSGAGWCVPWLEFGSALGAAVLEGSEGLRQRGSVAKKWVMDGFSWDRSARILKEFYASLRSRTSKSIR